MQKGFLFSVDLIIAITILVLILGSFYAFYNYHTDDVVEFKNKTMLETEMDIILNNIAFGKYNCNLIGANNRVIKKIAFCINKSKIKKDFPTLKDVNYTLRVGNQDFFGFNDSLPLKNYIAKDVNIWVSDKDLNKEYFFNCTEQGCDLKKQARIYVWK